MGEPGNEAISLVLKLRIQQLVKKLEVGRPGNVASFPGSPREPGNEAMGNEATVNNDNPCVKRIALE